LVLGKKKPKQSTNRGSGKTQDRKKKKRVTSCLAERREVIRRWGISEEKGRKKPGGQEDKRKAACPSGPRAMKEEKD